MNDVLKQRLVGALILVALGVIFWPIIFVQPGDKEVAKIESVPPRPGVAEQPIEPPDSLGLRTSPDTIVAETQANTEPDLKPEPEPEEKAAYPLPEAAPAVAVAKPQPALQAKKPAAATRDSAPKPLQMDSDGVPVAWILQIVSVSSAEKAEELRARLVALNYKAYVSRIESNGRVLHRVYLGPKFEKAVLEKLQPDINAEFGVQSMVRRYVP